MAYFSIKHTPEMIFWVRSDGSFYYANPAACEALGYTSLEMASLKAQDLLVDYDHNDRENLRKKIDDTGKYLIRLNLLRKDGSSFPVESLNKSIHLGNEVINCSFARDISDQVSTKQALIQTRQKFKRENEVLRSIYNLSDSLNIIGSSKALVDTLERGRNFAKSDAAVLITGESGVGKESMARFIHLNSKRKETPMITVNCATLTSSDVISQLFGHVKGAFTGAYKDREGLFALADHSSLFLDEVGELSFEAQAMLLRVVQSGEFNRMGDKKIFQTNVRLIAATNRNLREMVIQKKFREDLLYRLNVLILPIPPLRKRQSDLPQLVTYKLGQLNKQYGFNLKEPSLEDLDALQGYSFPGNIRELFNIIERAYFSGGGERLRINKQVLQFKTEDTLHNTSITALRENERNHILRALEFCEGQIGGKDGAAALLGIKRSTLNSKMKKLGIRG